MPDFTDRFAAELVRAANATEPTRGVSPTHPRRPRRRLRSRTSISHRALVISAALLIAACGTTLGLLNTSTIRPKARDFKRLYKASPRTVFAIDAQAPYAWRQPGVLLGTVHLATTLTLPGLGRLEYWLADSTKHWLCRAIRLPDGSWIGTQNKYDIGGLVPGCIPPDHVFHVNGFSDIETDIDALIDGQAWILLDGTAPTTGHPSAVRDLVSGATAPIVDRRYFLIAIAAHAVRCGNGWCLPHARYQLATVDQAGVVLVKRGPSVTSPN